MQRPMLAWSGWLLRNLALAACLHLPAAGAGSLAGGALHGLDARGSTLYAWGQNDYGQIGDGATFAARPVQTAVNLPAGVGAVQVAAGAYHTLAAGSDGKLYAWGHNGYGQLGDGTLVNRADPVVVALPAGVTPTLVAAGALHSLAAGSDGRLYAWGSNGVGQLGDGSTTNRSAPAVVALPPGVVAVALAAGPSHSLALGSDGRLYAWGLNSLGQLGDGTSLQRLVPVVTAMPPGVSARAVAAGHHFSLAVGSDGQLYAWGWNAFGQLGDGGTANRSIPGLVSLAPGVAAVALAAGQYHALAAGSDGRLYTWGGNGVGQLGDGTTLTRRLPAAVSLPFGVAPTVVAAGAFHSHAWGSDGKLYAWGANNAGQLGNGTTLDASVPAVVKSLLAQGIAFAPLADRPLGSAPFALAASASSGLPVSFSSLSPTTCIVSAGIVSLLAAGTCQIAADQAGDAAYAPALRVVQGFAVQSALIAQTITLTPISDRALGSGTLAPSASASSGLPVSFSSLTPSVCQVSGSSVTLLAAGLCTVAADQPGDATYAPAPQVSVTFTVHADYLPQSITFAPLPARELGSGSVSLSASASSGLPVQFSSLTAAVCTVSGTTASLVAAGTCIIAANQSGDMLYAAAPEVVQSFAVTPATAAASEGDVPLPPWALILLGAALLQIARRTPARR